MFFSLVIIFYDIKSCCLFLPFCGCVSCCVVSVVLSVLFLLFVLLFLLLKPANTLLGHCYFLLRCLYCFCCLLGSVGGVAFSLGVPP